MMITALDFKAHSNISLKIRTDFKRTFIMSPVLLGGNWRNHFQENKTEWNK